MDVYRGAMYEKYMLDKEAKKLESLQKRQIKVLKVEREREYLRQVSQSFLPKVSSQKQLEMEILRKRAEGSKSREPNPVKYNADSYKYDQKLTRGGYSAMSAGNIIDNRGQVQINRSIDWRKHKNTMIKPKKETPDFVKIDYLRFENKQEALHFSQNVSPKKSKEEKQLTVPVYKVPHKSIQAPASVANPSDYIELDSVKK